MIIIHVVKTRPRWQADDRPIAVYSHARVGRRYTRAFALPRRCPTYDTHTLPDHQPATARASALRATAPRKPCRRVRRERERKPIAATSLRGPGEGDPG